MNLQVTYSDGEPEQIEYHSMVYGLMRFEMVGSTAVVDDEWNGIDASALKDGFEQKVFTEDVVEAVEELPFVQAVTMEGQE
jgi:hypothetical protein